MECLENLFDLNYCAPSGPEFDVPGIDLSVFSGIGDAATAPTLRAAYDLAVRAAARRAASMFDDALARRFFVCYSRLDVAAFVPAPSGQPSPSGEWSFSFPAYSNLVFDFFDGAFFAATAGTVEYEVRVEYDDGSSAVLFSGSVPVAVGRNPLPSPPTFTAFHRAGGRVVVSWSSPDGASGTPLVRRAADACGCASNAAAASGLAYHVAGECSTRGLICANAEKFKNAVALLVAEHVYSSAFVGVKHHNLTTIKIDQKEAFRREAADRAAAEIARLAESVAPHCGDCCFKPRLKNELVWNV